MDTKQNCLCPLCGKPNECALAQSGSTETPCWCRNVEIDPSVMARIPEAQRGKSCICRQCATSRLPPHTENR